MCPRVTCRPCSLPLFLIVNLWNQFKCPSTYECIKNYKYTMKYNYTFKMKKIMSFTIIYMNLEDIAIIGTER